MLALAAIPMNLSRREYIAKTTRNGFGGSTAFLVLATAN